MARTDLNELLRSLMPFAQQMLATRGEFHPYAAIMKQSGEVVHVALEMGDQPCSSTEHIGEFVTLLRDMASDTGLRAVGIGFDVRTIPPGATEKSDAICIRLEHSDGEAVDVVLPYCKHGESIQYGQLFASQGPRHVFRKD